MMMPAAVRSWSRLVVLGLLLGGVVGGAQAQGSADSSAVMRPSLDKRVFDGIYEARTPVFQRTMRVADATAWPVFYSAVPAAWLGVWAVRGSRDLSDAYRLTLSELATLSATFGLKYLVRRARPYVRFPDIASRSGDIARRDPYSFPSGHAALAFALATSWTLSHPKWYVGVPSYLWATGVAVSRVWLGVHYPSDVLVGAVLGGVVAWGIHRLGDAVTPAFLRKDAAPASMPLLRLRIPLY